MDCLRMYLEYKGLTVKVKKTGSERDAFCVKEIFLLNNEGKLVAYAEMYKLELLSFPGEPRNPKIDGLSWFNVIDEHRMKGFGRVMACLVFLGTPSRGLKFTVLRSEVPFWEKMLGTGVDESGEVLIDAKEAKRLGVLLLRKVIPAHIWNSPQTRSMKRKWELL